MQKRQLLTLVLLCMLTTTFAQQSNISLSVSQQPISAVMQQLTALYQIQFAYSSDQVILSRTISITLNNVSLEEALKKIFANTGIAFSQNGNTVALYKDVNYRVTISGEIREKGTGELLIGVVVGADPPKSGAVSNAYGFYSLSLPPGTYTLQFNYLGFQVVSKKITLDVSQIVNIEMTPSTNLDEVIVKADANRVQKLNAFDIQLQEIKSIPMILGEQDVVKYAMLSPGIQKGNEGNSYLYVRGGGPDQNLILIDDAIIYNAYHFLGLASLFSGKELRNAELIKGGFSSRYGGRLSSVLDMSMKDGSREKFGIDATLGGISSRVMIEGPIVKNKSSFLISARKSYIDKVSGWIAHDQSSVLNYGFYDVHAKLSTDIGVKDRLMLSAYMGQDHMQTSEEQNIDARDDGIVWGNRAVSLRWNHQFSGKLFANTSLVNSYYNSRTAFAELDSQDKMINSSSIESVINDYGIKTDIEFFPFNEHRFRFGGGLTKHYFTPVTSIRMYQPDSSYVKDQSYDANEAFTYVEWEYKMTSKWQLISGMRFSYYENNKAYFRAEPRLNLQYKPAKNWLLSTTYSLMNQYMHLISTFSGFGFPNDLWVSSDENLAPQQSHLVTIGVTKKEIWKGISCTIEGYAKKINNAVGLRENASFFQVLPNAYLDNTVDKWSEITTQGNGQSYGIEYMLRKDGKHFEGWISYTLSKTTLQFDAINNGNPFPASFDRTHDLGIYASYETNKHWQFSANFVYGTGNAISLPVGEFYTYRSDASGNLYPSHTFLDYEKKNNYRMKAYHRLDISIQYSHLIAGKVKSNIEFSIYNVYNRANPFFYQLEQEQNSSGTGKRVLKQDSLFPIMPSISWSIKI